MFEIKALSLFSDLDLKVVGDFYFPLLGARATALYSLLREEERGEIKNHQSLFDKTLLSPGEWKSACEALEAVGLLKTYRSLGKGFQYFIYCLYAPKSPSEFLSDPLFYGTLRKTMKDDTIRGLAKKYSVDALPSEQFEDISFSFQAYFHPDISFGDNLSPLSSGSITSSEARLGFDLNIFDNSFASHGFPGSALSNEEILRIAKIATLYDLSEEAMGDIAFAHFDERKKKGETIDFASLTKEARESIRFQYLRRSKTTSSLSNEDPSSFANTVRLMDTLSPSSFLLHLQKGHKPASSDLKILEEVNVEMGLSSPATNALILYVLTKNGNVLSRAFVTKVAASLVRAAPATALDAMNFLASKPDFSGSVVLGENGLSFVPAPESKDTTLKVDNIKKEIKGINLSNNKEEPDKVKSKENKDDPSFEELVDFFSGEGVKQWKKR